MTPHAHLEAKTLRTYIRNGRVTLAGNTKLKIYGTLNCGSGKRMKKENRVFFKDAAEAEHYGFRPCGHCMKNEFRKWRSAKSRLREQA
jgi:methylphosphotriester-DNA--protein-cysteine methyltransferase